MKTTKLGSIYTDTAELLIGDPCKILYGDACLTDWDGYIDLFDHSHEVVEIPDAFGRTGAMSFQTGCDGYYPVYLETDDSGKPTRLVIELGGQVNP